MNVSESTLRSLAENKPIHELENIVHSLEVNISKKGTGYKVSKDKLKIYKQVLAERISEDVDSKHLEETDIPSECPLSVRVSMKHAQLYRSAKSRGKEFNLSHGDVRRLLVRKRCAYTGISLTDRSGRSEEMMSDRTIDRVDPEKGYVKGNVVAVCKQANNLKNHLLEDERSNLKIDWTCLRKFVYNLDKLMK